jgi:hypothetical protein
VKRGDRLGPYEILDQLGKGAMGEVYLARHPELGHHYAVKVLSSVYSEDPVVQVRFQREMASLAQVGGHPGIVRVHSGGTTPDHRAYYAMEFVQGTSLKEALKQGKLNHAQKLYAIECVADALAWAHAQGVVHRDVKPDNILIGHDGVIRLTDFGLALSNADTNKRLTMTGEMVGTPAYMAPEQVALDMGDVGPWTDVFALGAILYEVLVGKPPYIAPTSMEVYSKLMTGEAIVPPSAVEGSFEKVMDLDAEAICLRALERFPQNRFPDAAAFRDALRLAREPKVEATTQTPRALVFAAIGSLALCLLLIGVAFLRPAKPPVGDPGEEVPRLLATGQLDEAWRQGRTALAEGRAELEPVVAEAARKLLERAWKDDALDRVREVLGSGSPVEPFDDLPFLHAVVVGDPGAALATGIALAPAEAACYAAWADDRARLETELSRLPEDRRRALSWRLRAFVPDLEAPAGSLRPDGGVWGALASAEECLGRGLIGGALAAATKAQAAAKTDAEAYAAAIGLARASLATGDAATCGEQVGRAWDLADSPFERARCEGWLLRLSLLQALTPKLAQRRGSDPAAEIGARFPGLPACRGLQPELAPGLTAAGRGRRDPGQRESLRVRAGAATPAGSWFALERELCLSGFDGPLGLWLGTTATLAEAAEIGHDSKVAERADEALAALSAARPRSSLLRLARLRAALALVAETLGERALNRAQQAAKAASQLELGDDPVALGLLARVAWAKAQPALLKAEEALLGAQPQPDPKLDAMAAGLAGAAADAFAAVAEGQGEHPARDWARIDAGQALLARIRCLARSKSPPELSADQERLRELMAPLASESLTKTALEARGGWLAALKAADMSKSEDALQALAACLQGGPQRRALVLETLRLQASCGLPEASERAARAYLALAGDVPAQALLKVRRAELLDGGGKKRHLAQARKLTPHLPEVILEERCGEIDSGLGFAATAEAYLDLAEVVLRAPERAPSVVALLREVGGSPPSAEALAGRLETSDPELRAQAHLALALRHLREESRSDALLAAAHASQALAACPDAREAAWLVRALSLTAQKQRDDQLLRAAEEDLAAALTASPLTHGARWAQFQLRRWPGRESLADQLLAQGYLAKPEVALEGASGSYARLLTWLEQVLDQEDFSLESSNDLSGLAYALTEDNMRDRSTTLPLLARLALVLRLETGQQGNDGLDRGIEELYTVLPKSLRESARVLHDQGWWRWSDSDGDRWEERRGLAKTAAGVVRRHALQRPRQDRFVGWRARRRPRARVVVEDRTLPPLGSLDATLSRLTRPSRARYALSRAWRERPAGERDWSFTAQELLQPWSRPATILAGCRDPEVATASVDWWSDEHAWADAVLALARAAAFDPREQPGEVLLELGFDELFDRVIRVAEDLPETRDELIDLLEHTLGLSHWAAELTRHEGQLMGFRVLRVGALLDLAALEEENAASRRLAALREAVELDMEDPGHGSQADEWERLGRWYQVRARALDPDREGLTEAAEVFQSWFDDESRRERNRVRRLLRGDLDLQSLREVPELGGLLEALRVDEDEDEDDGEGRDWRRRGDRQGD